MNAFTTLSASGEVAVPQATRDRLGWHAGLDLEMIEIGDSVTFRPRRTGHTIAPAEAVRMFEALRRHDGPPVVPSDMRQDARRMAAGEDAITE